MKKIYMLAGKARNGKDTTGADITDANIADRFKDMVDPTTGELTQDGMNTVKLFAHLKELGPSGAKTKLRRNLTAKYYNDLKSRNLNLDDSQIQEAAFNKADEEAQVGMRIYHLMSGTTWDDIRKMETENAGENIEDDVKLRRQANVNAEANRRRGSNP